MPKTKLPPAKIGQLDVVWACRIRQLRDEAGYTLRDLERMTGLTNAVISFVERGTNPTLDTAMKLAAVFGLKIEDVWTRL